MNQICVYSENPIRENPAAHGLEIQTMKRGGQYCAFVKAIGLEEIKAEERLLDFVFFALVQRNVMRTLRVDQLDQELDARLTETFSEKLAEYLCATGAKQKIEDRVRNILGRQGIIHLDGTMNFRLREFGEDVKKFFEGLFYEYQVRKQYEDFILLIKEFVETERPLESVLHVVFENHGFSLYDGEGRNITKAAMQRYQRDIRGAEGNSNDFLISSLLEHLPRKIAIHCAEEEALSGKGVDLRIIETIRMIFGGRVEIRAGRKE